MTLSFITIVRSLAEHIVHPCTSQRVQRVHMVYTAALAMATGELRPNQPTRPASYSRNRNRPR
eukprot:scaffold17298_cov30-Tisochrysis_lutea.AAC.1